MAKIGKKTKSVKKKVARLIQDYHDQQRRRDASMAKAADHDLFFMRLICTATAEFRIAGRALLSSSTARV